MHTHMHRLKNLVHLFILSFLCHEGEIYLYNFDTEISLGQSMVVMIKEKIKKIHRSNEVSNFTKNQYLGYEKAGPFN